MQKSKQDFMQNMLLKRKSFEGCIPHVLTNENDDGIEDEERVLRMILAGPRVKRRRNSNLDDTVNDDDLGSVIFLVLKDYPSESIFKYIIWLNICGGNKGRRLTETSLGQDSRRKLSLII